MSHSTHETWETFRLTAAAIVLTVTTAPDSSLRRERNARASALTTVLSIRGRSRISAIISMNNTPNSPAQMPDDCTDQGGNYRTLFTPGIWKDLHAVLQTAIVVGSSGSWCEAMESSLTMDGHYGWICSNRHRAH